MRRVATALATSLRSGLADGDRVLMRCPQDEMAVERGYLADYAPASPFWPDASLEDDEIRLMTARAAEPGSLECSN